MNERQKSAPHENLYLRGVLLPRSAAGDISKNSKFCGCPLQGKDHVEGEAATYGFLELTAESKGGQFFLPSKTPVSPLPPSLAKRFLSGRKLVFRCLVCDVPHASVPAVLFCSPLLPGFSEVLTDPATPYFRFDLRALCNDLFTNPRDTRIQIVRLNSKVQGDKAERVNAVMLTGASVLASDSIRDLMVFNSKSRDKKPFDPLAVKNQTVQRYLDPMSCRLSWDDGTEDPFPLNIDRFGNLSFYFRNGKSLKALLNIFRYLFDVGTLAEAGTSPVKRDPKALDQVAAP